MSALIAISWPVVSQTKRLGQVAEHARSAHGMDEVPAELAEKAKAAIKDEERV